MDGQRFDSLVKSLARGASRRAVLKGALGLGGAVVAGSVVGDADAARRSTPTPAPPKCPTGQHWGGSSCVCNAGTVCGSDCCSAGSTCCDNACCDGSCYGEELCCPAGRDFCATTGDCCPPGTVCCGELGCQTRCCGPNSCGGECGECGEGQVCNNGLCFWSCNQNQNACDSYCGASPHLCLVSGGGDGYCVSSNYDGQCTAGCPNGGVCYGPYCITPC